MPEFFQMLCEDSIILVCYLNIHLLYHRYTEMKALSTMMETSFSNSDVQITAKCEKKANKIAWFFMTGAVCVEVGKVIEVFLPLPDQELQTVKLIYNTKYPSRRLHLPIHIPYLDESELWYTEVINGLEFHVAMLFLVVGLIIGNLIPSLIIHIEGQYKILTGYVEQIGKTHRDREGRVVYYINLDTDEYVVEKTMDIPYPSELKRTQYERKIEESRILYETLYVKQLVIFHQKCPTFSPRWFSGNLSGLVVR
ncbi:hypothetical protein WDU94_010561 [Cyamophila willieti]